MPRQDMRALFLELLRDELLQRLPMQERIATAVDGLMLTRIDSQLAPEQCLYYPLIALVVQGKKQAFYGEREIAYGAGEYVVLGNDMPGVFHVIGPTAATPFLSLSIRFEPRIVASLSLEGAAPIPAGKPAAAPIGKEEAPEALLLAFYRLVRLLAEPGHVARLAPAIIREIHYLILTGPLGERLRLASIPGTRDHRIAQSIAWLRSHFRETFSMQELARRFNMAPSTFNRYFRENTSVSPLQFQKRLRLYEAQRLMRLESHDARTAALAVGYESEAHFSRDYKRLFGNPPGRDARA